MFDRMTTITEQSTVEAEEHENVSEAVILRKKYRFKNNTIIKRHIGKLQNSTNLLMPKSTFRRLVQEITNDFKSDMRYSAHAVSAIQEAAENYITDVLHAADKQCMHGARKTLMPKDIKMACDTLQKF
jgi:histone H3